MKIGIISDTHNHHRKLGKLEFCDMFIFAGDLSSSGLEEEVTDFLSWFNELPAKYRLFIAGNHDLCFESKPSWLISLLSYYKDITYLENSGIEIEDIKIWGSPVSPKFGRNWAFNKERGNDIRKIWDLIPLDTDILITHTPSFGCLDFSNLGKMSVGCEDLKRFINIIQPQYHICGHIHESYGMKETENTTYINASIIRDYYTYSLNKPIYIEI